MKECGKCGILKEEIEYALKKGKLQWQCKDCQRAYRREHYLKNRQKYIDKASNYTKETMKKVWEYKTSKGCADCGVTDYRVLDFDHLRDKEFQISTKARIWSWERLQPEIEKCEVVCSNCHRIRTFERGQWASVV